MAFLLLCAFQPAMATLSTVTLGFLTLQPAMAPEFPWWRCRYWRRRAYMRDANGWCTELSSSEHAHLVALMDDHAAIEFYVMGQSHLCDIQQSWEVPARKPHWSDQAMGWLHPGFDQPAMAAPARRINARSQPARARGSSPGREPARERSPLPRRSPYPERRNQNARATSSKPEKAASTRSHGDAFANMFRGQTSKAKRTARRALERAGQPVPESLQPGKAIEDLPAKARSEGQHLQRRLKELRHSGRPINEVEAEISKCKRRLHDLLHGSDEYTYDDDDEEQAEEEEEEVDVEEEPEEETEAVPESLKEAAEAKRIAKDRYREACLNFKRQREECQAKGEAKEKCEDPPAVPEAPPTAGDDDQQPEKAKSDTPVKTEPEAKPEEAATSGEATGSASSLGPTPAPETFLAPEVPGDAPMKDNEAIAAGTEGEKGKKEPPQQRRRRKKKKANKEEKDQASDKKDDAEKKT